MAVGTSQRSNVRRVRISCDNFAKKNTDKFGKAQFNRKFSVVSENLIFLRRVSFQNEVDVTDKFLIIGRKFGLSGHSVIRRFQYYGLHSRTCLN